jgi:hypothetical protein
MLDGECPPSPSLALLHLKPRVEYRGFSLRNQDRELLFLPQIIGRSQPAEGARSCFPNLQSSRSSTFLLPSPSSALCTCFVVTPGNQTIGDALKSRSPSEANVWRCAAASSVASLSSGLRPSSSATEFERSFRAAVAQRPKSAFGANSPPTLCLVLSKKIGLQRQSAFGAHRTSGFRPLRGTRSQERVKSDAKADESQNFHG